MKLHLAERQIFVTMQQCTDCTVLRREIVNLRGFVSDCFSTMLKRFDGQDQNIQWLMEAMQSLSVKLETDKQQTETTMTEMTESPPARPPRLPRKRPRMQIEHRLAAAQSQRVSGDQQQQQQQIPTMVAAPALQPAASSTWNMNASPAISQSPSGTINGTSSFGATFRSAITVSSFGDSTASAVVSSHGYRTTGPPNVVHIRQHQEETVSDEGPDTAAGESTGATTTGTVLIKAEPLGSDFFEDTSASNVESDTGREEGEIIEAIDEESPEGGADEFVGYLDDESFKEVYAHVNFDYNFYNIFLSNF